MKQPFYLLQLLIFILSAGSLWAEGTKELMPDETHPTRILLSTQSGRDPFALEGAGADYRLYIHITNPLTEKIYFGFGQLRNNMNGNQTGSLVYRIYSPDNTLLCSGNTATVGQPGFIDTYAEAVAGPSVVDPAGYDGIFCTPTVSGDYYFTFDMTALNNTSRSFDFFDITIVNTGVVPNSDIPGRVFSKSWQIRNPDVAGDFYNFFGDLFIYSNDGIVTKLDPNGFEGRDFSLTCNESGCYPIGPGWNAQQARQSQPGGVPPTPHTYPQYKIFLNNPDQVAYPDGVIGQLVAGSVSTQTFCSTGTVNFNFQTTPLNAIGTVEIILSLSTLSPPLVDRILITNNVPGGNYSVTWDGLDGVGTQVPSGSTFPFTLRYTNGLTNMPLWDVEQNVNGFLVTLVRPVLVPPLADPAFYWDDTKTGVGGGSMLTSPGCSVPPSTSCHAWGDGTPYPGDWGNNKTINTWWYLVSNSTVPVNVTYKRGPDTLIALNPPAQVCPGGSVSVTVASDPGTQQYHWAWSGGSQVTAVPTINITYAVTVTPGPSYIKFWGSNIDCGDGPRDSIPITILPFPAMSVLGDDQVCLGEQVTYTTQPGQFNYIWSTSGGTIITSSGNQATILWPAAGSHSVSVLYTSSLGCTPINPFVYPVTVNPPPVPLITGSTSECEGAMSVVYTAQAGNTNYTWSVSVGGTITSGGGATDPSATVTWHTAGPQSVSVGFTDGMTGCVSASPAMLPVTVKPLPVPSLSGPADPCDESAGNVYTTESGKLNYAWDIPGSATVTAGGTSASNTVTLTWNTPGPATLLVVYTDDVTGCTAANPTPFDVLVKPLPTPTIAGPAQVCLGVPGQVYSTETGMTGYTWAIVPASAGTITSGAGSDAVIITWNQTGVAQVSLNYTDNNTGCTAVAPTLYDVNVNPLPAPTISGTNTICTGIPVTYSTQSGLSGYTWIVSAGGTIVSGGQSTDPTITVNWISPGAQSVSVNYTIGTGCTAASPAVYPVTVNQSTPPVITSPVNPICENQSTTYTVQSGMTGYTWSVSPGGTFTSATTGNTVTVLWTAAGSRYVEVNFTNGFGCTAPAPTQYSVSVNPLPVTTISSGSGPECQNAGHLYQTPANPACNFTWSVIPAGAGIVSAGQGGSNVTIDWITPGASTISVTGTIGTTGCSTTSTLPVVVYPAPTPVFYACFDLKTTPQAKKFTLRGAAPFVTGQGVFSGSRVSLNGVSGLYEFDPFGAPVGSYQVTYTYTNAHGCITSTPAVTIQVMNSAFSCGGLLTDVRDGKTYRTSLIGSRCWMKDNLAYGTKLDPSSIPQTDNCQPEKYCGPADPNCTQYGGYYQWDEVMAYGGTSQNQGICPPEWHLPTESEWQSMLNAISNGITPPADGVAGAFLKDQNSNPGFAALLGGVYYLNESWAYTGGTLTGTLFWTSTPHGTTRHVARGINLINPSTSWYAGSSGNAFNVRCVRD